MCLLACLMLVLLDYGLVLVRKLKRKLEEWRMLLSEFWLDESLMLISNFDVILVL